MTLFVRTKQKDSEFRDDRHHFSNKWVEVPTGEISSVHIDHPNLEVVEDKKRPMTELQAGESTQRFFTRDAPSATIAVEVSTEAPKEEGEG